MATTLRKVRHGLARLRALWLSQSRADIWVVAALAVGHVLAVLLVDAPALLTAVPVERRPSLYGASAVVVSLTGTLASVSVAQYLSGRGDRVKALKRGFADELARTWKSVFVGSIVAATLFLTAYAIDSRASGSPAPDAGSWVFELGAALALLRLLRLTALFGGIVDLIVLDDTEPLSEPPVVLEPAFFEGLPPTPRQPRRRVGDKA